MSRPRKWPRPERPSFESTAGTNVLRLAHEPQRQLEPLIEHSELVRQDTAIHRRMRRLSIERR